MRRIVQPQTLVEVTQPMLETRPSTLALLHATTTVAASDKPAMRFHAEKPRSFRDSIALVDAADIRVLNPLLSRKISDLVNKTDDGIARDQVQVPISASESPRDDQLLDDPKDASIKWYIPKFRLASTGGRYVIELRPRVIDGGTTVGEGAVLAFKLERFPAAAIAGAARTAKEVATSITVRIEHRVLVDGIPGPIIKLDAEQVIPTPEGAEVLVSVASLAARDQLYAALSDPKYATKIVVVRMVQIAVPIATEKSSPGWSGLLQQVDKSMTKAAFVKASALKPIVRGVHPGVRLMRAGGPMHSAVRFQPSDGVTLGPQVDMRRALDFRLSQEMQNQLRLKQPPTPPNLYREVNRSLESRLGVEPTDSSVLAFNPALHAYVFAIGIASGLLAGGLMARDVMFPAAGTIPSPGSSDAPSKSFRYYQSSTHANVFYYFPDRFRLARASSAPCPLLARVRIIALEGKDDPVAVADFTVLPTVSSARLALAKASLKKFLPIGAADPDLQPISLDPASLRLELTVPGLETLDELREVPSALIDLECGASFQIQLTIAQLQRVFDALCGAEQRLLLGRVKASMNGAVVETIDVSIRVDDALGSVLQHSETSVEQGGAIQLDIRNVAESPVKIDGLQATLVVRQAPPAAGVAGVNGLDRSTPARLDVVDMPKPATLLAGTSWRAIARPTEALSADDRLIQVLLNADDLDIEPDRDALWASILDRRQPLGISRQIVVEAIGDAFGASVPNPVTDLLIRFRTSEQIRLSATASRGLVTLRVSVDDVALGRANELQYEYQVTTVRSSLPPSVSEWISGRDTTLFVTAT